MENYTFKLNILYSTFYVGAINANCVKKIGSFICIKLWYNNKIAPNYVMVTLSKSVLNSSRMLC